MNFKTSMVVALTLTAFSALFFLIASPIVPMARQQVWLLVGLTTAALAVAAWVMALQARSNEESSSTKL